MWNPRLICFTVDMNTPNEQPLINATADEAAAQKRWKAERKRLLDELRESDNTLVFARHHKRDQIIAARENGMPVARISRLAKITRQRVYQIVKEI